MAAPTEISGHLPRAAAPALTQTKGAIVNFSSLALFRPMAPMAITRKLKKEISSC